MITQKNILYIFLFYYVLLFYILQLLMCQSWTMLFAFDDPTPDLFIIFVIWLTLKEGTYFGLFAGFFIGLLFDIISVDIIGTNALAKTVAAFIAGFFYKERETSKITKSNKFILITLLVTLIHNLIYFFFYIKTSDQNFMVFYLRYGLSATLYTTFCASLVFLFQIPSNHIKV